MQRDGEIHNKGSKACGSKVTRTNTALRDMIKEHSKTECSSKLLRERESENSDLWQRLLNSNEIYGDFAVSLNMIWIVPISSIGSGLELLRVAVSVWQFSS